MSCENPRYWTGVNVQGAYNKFWISSIMVVDSINGKKWNKINEGVPFVANTDAETKLRIRFPETVYARTIRLYPVTWHESMVLRFDAVYLDLE